MHPVLLLCVRANHLCQDAQELGRVVELEVLLNLDWPQARASSAASINDRLGKVRLMPVYMGGLAGDVLTLLAACLDLPVVRKLLEDAQQT